MISVVIPLYNKEKTIARALQSVLNQTYQDFEVVVVNDGSTDNSAAEVRQFSDSRIRLVEQANAGVSAARNRGVSEARAERVAFLDADDEWLPGFFKCIISLWEAHPECSVAATSYVFVRGDGRVCNPVLRGFPSGRWRGVVLDYFYVASISDPPLCSSALGVTKTSLQAVGGFPVGVASGEDLLTWARIAASSTIAYDTAAHARFSVPEDVFDRKPRLDCSRDVVAEELLKLRGQVTTETSSSLQRYIGLWYLMRASAMLQSGQRRLAFTNAVASMRFRSVGLKPLAFMLLCCMPRDTARGLMRCLRDVWRTTRSWAIGFTK